MGKLGDELRREQEEDAAAEVEKLVSSRPDGGGKLSDGIHRRDVTEQLLGLRKSLSKFREIDKDQDVYHLFRDYPALTYEQCWGAVKDVRAARHPREKSDTREAEFGRGDNGFVRRPTQI